MLCLDTYMMWKWKRNNTLCELVVPIMISLIEDATNKEAKCSLWLSWIHHFESFTVATMTWWNVKEKYLCLNWSWICLVCRNYNPIISSFMTFHRVCKKSNATGATCGGETAYPSAAPEFTPDFKWCSCCSIFSFLCNVL